MPRNVRLTPRGLAFVVMAAALTAGAVLCAIVMSVAVAAGNEERRLREREGVPAEAEIVLVTPRRGDTPRRVTYRYSVDGRDYTGRARLRNRDVRRLREGAPIAVNYVRSRPETSWISGYEPEGIPLWVIPLTAMSLLAGAAGVAWQLRQQWILLAEGRVGEAHITEQKKARRGGYRVSYEFRALSGATLRGRINMEKAPPSVGATMPVLYHRDRPGWSALYPLPLVRAARTARGPK